MDQRVTWTGGWHSLLRALFGAWLAWWLGSELLAGSPVHALPRTPPDAWVVGLLRAAGLFGAVAFALGWRTRWCALGLAALALSPLAHVEEWAALVLVLFALHPPAPYGSLDARGRVDPRGGAEGPWRRPEGWSAALFVLVAAWLGIQGLSQLGSPSWRSGEALGLLVEDGAAGAPLRWLPTSVLPLLTTLSLAVRLAFVPALFVPRLRPWVWFAGLAVLLLEAPLFAPLLVLFLLAFDPGWLAPRPRVEPGGETIFYDGSCGLCHRAVRFVLAEDTHARYVFAPLESEAFAPYAERASTLGDTMIVARADGNLAVRSDAWIAILRGLGGGWRGLGGLLALVPRPLRDLVYDGVARARKRVFAKPDAACPMLPPDLGQRFRA